MILLSHASEHACSMIISHICAFFFRDEEAVVLERRLNQMRLEIEKVKSSSLKALPPTDGAKCTALESELEKSLKELQETHTFTNSQLVELQHELNHESEINKQLKSILESVKLKLENNSLQSKETNKELAAKIEDVRKTFDYIRKNLVAFIKQHFPLPSTESVNEAKKKLRSSGQKIVCENLMPLKEILELLLDKSLEDPNDAYITMDDGFWPPYVELLLRCKIVVRHKDDEQRIRLVSFHL